MKGWAETSLVGEWLRVFASTAGGVDLIPGWWQWAGVLRSCIPWCGQKEKTIERVGF